MANEPRTDFTLMASVERLNTTVEKLSNMVGDMRIMIAENYVKKTECVDCRKASSGIRNQIMNWVIGIQTVVITAIGIYASLKK